MFCKNNINFYFGKNVPTNKYDVQKSKVWRNGFVTIFGKLLSFIETIFLMLLLFFIIIIFLSKNFKNFMSPKESGLQFNLAIHFLYNLTKWQTLWKEFNVFLPYLYWFSCVEKYCISSNRIIFMTIITSKLLSFTSKTILTYLITSTVWTVVIVW